MQNDWPISIDNWNYTLSKSKIFAQSWASQSIKTKDTDYFEDIVTGHKSEWIKGVSIKLNEIVTLKLYTDFDKLQFELKKCFRFDTYDDILDEYDDEKKQYIVARDKLKHRLRSFYHWRGALLIVLKKFGTKFHGDNNIKLYHGVNAKMIVKPSQTLAFSGPLSATSSYHVAKTFATAKGMVLEITACFPRLNYSYALDASLFSDFPEEQEWLIGFMYARLLVVNTRNYVCATSRYRPP